MARIEDGSIHQLTDTQVIEAALGTPPPGGGLAYPWLRDGPTSHLALEPVVCPYAAALRLVLEGADTYESGAPRRHVMAVRSDQGCFAVAWELSLPRLHHLGQLEAAAAAPATASPAAAAPVSAPLPAVPASASHPQSQASASSAQAALLARISAYNSNQ